MEILPPETCQDMAQIRAGIDTLDREVIALLGRRFQYVLAAAKFKTTAGAVRAPERFQAMLAQRRTWAAEEGLDPDAVEKLYRDLVEHFIAEEMKRWQTTPPR